MSSPMSSQLINLLLDQHPASAYIAQFSDLFTWLSQELSTQFSNCLVSTFDMVRTTLPSALVFPPQENLFMSPNFHALLTEFTNLLTITLSTVLTIFTVFVPSQYLSEECSKILTILNTALYVNPSPNLPSLLNSLFNSMGLLTDTVAMPHSALTNFPYELYSLLNYTLPSDLQPLSKEPDIQIDGMVNGMYFNLYTKLEDLNAKLLDVLNNSSAALDYHLERLTVAYVYKARKDANTDPDNCGICLEVMKDGDKSRRLRCLHTFHRECIDRWLDTNKTCPICRTHIDSTLNGACTTLFPTAIWQV